METDGAAPTAENVKAGTYKVVRPFNIATKGEASEVAQDFIHFIMSADGQKVVSENGYITVDDAVPAYAASGVSGIVVGGSSSVIAGQKEGSYMPNPTLPLKCSRATYHGHDHHRRCMTSAWASRELKDSEFEAGLTHRHRTGRPLLSRKHADRPLRASRL